MSDPSDTDIQDALRRIFSDTPTQMTLSNPRSKGDAFRRSTLRLLGDGRFQVEETRGAQTFHDNIDATTAEHYCTEMLAHTFRQLDAKGATTTFELRLSRKGKPSLSARHLPMNPDDPPAPDRPLDGNDREKKRILDANMPLPVLADLGVCTPDGRITAARFDKYRQINRFIEMVDDALKDFASDHIEVIDFGCGRSYLTFVIYHYLTEIRGLNAHVTGLDLKADVIASCEASARRYGYDGLHFELGDIAGYTCTTAPDLVVTLHACDTATDHALANAVDWDTGTILSVPCCQHELAAQISSEDLSILTRFGIIREREAALMTDAIRADLLISKGYRTQLLEFVDFEHTPKNLLIRATKASLPQSTRDAARAEVDRLVEAFHLDPTLLRLLDGR